MNKKILSVSAIVLIALAFSLVAVRTYSTTPATSNLVVYNRSVIYSKVVLNVTAYGSVDVQYMFGNTYLRYNNGTANLFVVYTFNTEVRDTPYP